MFTPSLTAAPPAYLTRVDSPLGRIELTSDGEAITSLSIERDGSLPFDDLPERSSPLLRLAARQLREYFAGARRVFELPVAAHGSPFQEAIWARLADIPFGEARSYGDLGVATGRAASGRAVGGAVAANPVPIIIPDHRVLASGGRITGYSGGQGVATKEWLLVHEGVPFKAAPAPSDIDGPVFEATPAQGQPSAT